MSGYWAHISVSPQVGVLEQDAMEVLSLIRSMKNHLAPINRIPPDVFSLVLGYWSDTDMDEILITMTHVCRGWRELLIARTWLWARLDCTNADKTRVYIERAKSSPMKISLFEDQDRPHLEQALLRAVPHFRRLKSLTVVGTSDLLQNLSKHLTLPTPFLGELIIDLTCNPAPVLDDMLFNGDLSSLRILSLGGVITHLPWKNLRSLTTFKLRCAPGNKITMTHLLNFLQNALHLRDITLDRSIPTSSNAPPSQMVLLPSLKRLTIIANPSHPILNHLCIPVGASLVLDFKFSGDKSPLLDLLPKTAKDHVYDVATVNLCFDKRNKFVQLIRPSGGLTIFGHWKDYVEIVPSRLLDNQILQSLDQFHLYTTRRLAITKCGSPAPIKINTSPHYHILDRMRQLRTLTLIRCYNLPFILSLDPERNPSGSVLCPELEELVLYIKARKLFNIVELMKMAKERASKNAKLWLITIIGLDELIPGKEVFKLREHVTRGVQVRGGAA